MSGDAFNSKAHVSFQSLIHTLHIFEESNSHFKGSFVSITQDSV